MAVLKDIASIVSSGVFYGAKMKITKELKRARIKAKQEKNYIVADKLELIINLVNHHKIKRNATRLINS